MFTIDDVYYSSSSDSGSIFERMVEIEDKVDPKLNVEGNDEHMIKAHELMLNSKFSKLIIPTKNTKVQRAGILTNTIEL